jgi:uncharacterized membrane protein
VSQVAQNLKSELVNGPVDRLKSEATGLLGALGDKAVSSLKDKVEDASGRLSDYTEGGGGPGLMAAVTGAKGLAEGESPARAMVGAGMTGVKEKVKGMFGKGGGKGGGGKKLKVTNVVESIDVGVPISLAYNQWTQFTDFPSFMKKVENVEQPEPEKLTWKAQILWSHRTWESTIMEQVPDDKIVWRSKGEKGYVDGAVTFHELAPNLTRILLVLEYHPQGFFEHTGNLWRAQGRRTRLELKHFRRQLMSEALLHPDEIEGWRGEIHEGEVAEGGDQNGQSDGKRSEDSAEDGDGRRSSTTRRRKAESGEQESRSSGNGRRSGESASSRNGRESSRTSSGRSGASSRGSGSRSRAGSGGQKSETGRARQTTTRRRSSS